MTDRVRRWLVPVVGAVLGLLIALATMGRSASPLQAAVAFAIVLTYALGIRFLQSRSEAASLLSGIAIDERWESINRQALSLTAQVMAAVIVGAFITVSFAGGDAMPYAWLAGAFAAAYLGGILWYRWRS